MYLFTKSHMEMVEVKHPVYPGSSSGDLIGPIQLEPFSQRAWMITEADKKNMYSANFRIAVGGPTDTAPQESAKRSQYKVSELKRKPLGVSDEATLFEPFCYHGMPPEFYKDIFTVWSPKAIIDFTASDLTPAIVALELKLPYLGIVFTEAHLTAGYKHLAELVFECMQNETSPLHDAKLSALVHNKGQSKSEKPERKRKTQKQEEDAGKEDPKPVDKGEDKGNGTEDGKGKQEESEEKGGENKPPKKPRVSNGDKNQSNGKQAQTSIDQLMNQLKGLRSQ